MAGSTIWAPVGDKGPTGDKGPPGDQGPVGNQGPQGGPGPDAAAFVQFVADLASSNDANKGAALVGYKGRTLFAWLNDVTAIPSSYALLADATTQIQALIDALPAGGTLTGNGYKFIVKALNLKSNMRFKDAKFLTKAGAVIGEFWSPITVGAYNDTTLRENIELDNLWVDGNRVLNETGTTGGEDGGKHGFRFIGKINNLLVRNCTAINCGSYGFFNFVGSLSGSTGNDIPIQNNVVYLDNYSAGNKAHGFAADAVKGIKYINNTGTNNGFDITGSPGGTITGGLYYGNGIDIEGYGIDSCVEDVFLFGNDFRNNRAASIFISDIVLKTNPNFKMRKNIRILNNLVSPGGVGSNSAGISIDIEPPFANWSLGAIYDDIVIKDNVGTGKINIICATNVIFDNTQLGITGNLGDTAYATLTVNNQSRLLFNNLSSLSTVSYAYEITSSLDANSNRQWQRTEKDGFVRQGIYSARIAFNANEEKSVVIPFIKNLADNAYSVVPAVKYVSVNSDVGTPVILTATNTSVTVVIKNGATAQSIGLYCLVEGIV